MIGSLMGYLTLALASAVLLGVWKFGLGMYRGRVTVWTVILVSASAAAVMYLVLGTLTGDLAFDPTEVDEGLLGGAGLLDAAGVSGARDPDVVLAVGHESGGGRGYWAPT